MSVPLTINGVTFQYPQEFDKHWGPTLTNWSIAVTNALAPLTGGFLTLSPFPSTGILFANATNTGFLPLTVNGSNQLTFNGVPIAASNSLTDGHIFVGNALNHPADVAMTGDITISNTGVTTLGALKVTDSQISATASIALSKLASTTAYFWYAANGSGVLTPLGVTASKVVITDANGLPSTSTVTPTTLAFLDATSSVQTQLNNRLSLSGGTLSGTLNMGSNQIINVGPATLTGQVLSYGNPLNGTTLTLTGQLLAEDGTITAPAYSFTNAVTSGIRHVVFPTVSAGAASWNTSTHFVTITNHGLVSGTVVQLTTTGTLPTGLSLATNYWVVYQDANRFGLADSLINELDGIVVAFSTQGTGIHTVTPISVGDIGVSVKGVDMCHFALQDGATTGTLYVGDVNLGSGSQFCEVIHAQGNYTAGGGVPSAADIVVLHNSGQQARMICQSYPDVVGSAIPTLNYIISHGPNETGPYFSGGPNIANSCEYRSQNVSTSGTIFTTDSHYNYFLSNEGGGPYTICAIISKTGIVPTRSDSDPTPFEEGQMYYNTSTHQMKYWNGSTWHVM